MKIYRTKTQEVPIKDASDIEGANVAICPSCWEERELFEVDEDYLCASCLEGGI